MDSRVIGTSVEQDYRIDRLVCERERGDINLYYLTRAEKLLKYYVE